MIYHKTPHKCHIAGGMWREIRGDKIAVQKFAGGMGCVNGT
jgi:hypothetical protein